MRRWIAIFLLLVLPAQFSWAVAAAYCGHEQGATPQQHLGHHAHEHAPSAASATATVDAAVAGHADDGAAPELPGTDADCAYCHLSLAQTLTTTAPMPLVPAAAPRPGTRIAGAASSLFERIERPNWRRA